MTNAARTRPGETPPVPRRADGGVRWPGRGDGRDADADRAPITAIRPGPDPKAPTATEPAEERRFGASPHAAVRAARVDPAASGCTPEAIAREVERAVGARKFQMWFRDTGILVRADGSAEIRGANAYVSEWIGRHFRGELDEAVARAGATGYRITVAPDAADDPAPAAGEPAEATDTERQAAAAIAAAPRPARAEASPSRRPPLRDLEGFVLGSCNQLAFDAARRLADGEAVSSLLVVHGECGVGKTHLLQGICRRRRERFPGQTVRYLTAEQFTNDFLASLRDGTLAEFRRRLRRIDLLAIDDVHFLANKTQTQAEFLHTLDALALSGGKVALAGDEHPRAFRRFSESLVSRFLSGMVVRVDRPDRTTRLSLIRTFARTRGLRLGAAAEEIVAGRCVGSVREIEGGLARLEAMSTLFGEGDGEIGAILAERAFADEGLRTGGPVRIQEVVRTCCEALAVDPADLVGPGRHRRVVLARGLVVFLAREMTTMSFPEIARALGRDTHSTAHTAARRTEAMVAAGERVEPGDPTLAGPDGTVSLGELLVQLRHRIRVGSRRGEARG